MRYFLYEQILRKSPSCRFRSTNFGQHPWGRQRDPSNGCIGNSLKSLIKPIMTAITRQSRQVWLQKPQPHEQQQKLDDKPEKPNKPNRPNKPGKPVPEPKATPAAPMAPNPKGQGKGGQKDEGKTENPKGEGLLTKEEKAKTPCLFFPTDTCFRNNCPYLHDANNSRPNPKTGARQGSLPQLPKPQPHVPSSRQLLVMSEQLTTRRPLKRPKEKRVTLHVLRKLSSLATSGNPLALACLR